MVNNNNNDCNAENNCSNCSKLKDEILGLQRQLADMDQRAHHDVLTGLPNRRYFLEALHHRIMRCQRYGDNCALLFLDVDNLKSTNDLHGHVTGDAMLVRLAQILNNNLRVLDVTARIGGDEFAILLDNLDADEVESKIAFLADRIASAKVKKGDISVDLSAAIGYCFIGPTDKVSDLMSRADAAMYEAKTKK